jgi:RNA polymerase sigma-70 factor (ECF subfamily)
MREQVFDQDLTALARSAAAGNQAAFAALAESCHARIFRYLARKTGSRHLAEDLTQDVFVKALRHIGRLTEPERFVGWLYGIALNRLRDHARHLKLRRLLFLPSGNGSGPPEDVPDPADDLAEVGRKEFWQRVAEFSAGLSAREREVFGLRFLDGLQLSEVAEALGVSQSAVKTHLSRAVAKFRDDTAFMAFLEGERR